MNTLPSLNLVKSLENSASETPNSQPIYALISVHGDPTAEIGKEGAGGQNVYVRELGLALAKRGCQVDMFTRREYPHQEEIVELAPGCRTIRLNAGPAEFITRNDLFEYLPEFVEAWLNFQQRTGRSYALIHTNYWLSAWVGLELKSRLGLPQVHTYHSIGAVKYRNVENPPQIAAIRHCVENAILEQADYVISTSPQEAEDLRQLISQYGRIKVIPCGINTEHFGSVSSVACALPIACSITDDGIAVSKALSTVPDSTFGTNKENSLSCIFAVCTLMTILSLHGLRA